MTYLVNITARAGRDFAHLYDKIDAENSVAALKWYRELKEAVLTLEKFPYRCPTVCENPLLRQLLYGHKPHVYRVIYRVLHREKRVDVLHLRHGARQDFSVIRTSTNTPASLP